MITSPPKFFLDSEDLFCCYKRKKQQKQLKAMGMCETWLDI